MVEETKQQQFTKGEVVTFLGERCRVLKCSTEPHYDLVYIDGIHRGQRVVGSQQESKLKRCPEFDAIPFKIGDRIREKDYETSIGTIIAFNTDTKGQPTVIVRMDEDSRIIQGCPDEFVLYDVTHHN